MVLPNITFGDFTGIKIKTTRPYTYVKRQEGAVISKITPASPYKVGIQDDVIYTKVATTKCCSNFCL